MMHDCNYYEDLCSLSLDDELTAAERAALEAHLTICPACASYMEQLREMQKLLAVDSLTAPSSLHEDIMELVLADAQKTASPVPVKKRFVPVFTMLAAAAAAVMLVTSGTVGDMFRSSGNTGAMPAAADSAAMDTGAAAGGTDPAVFGVEKAADVPVQEIKPSLEAGLPEADAAAPAETETEKKQVTVPEGESAPKKEEPAAPQTASENPPKATENGNAPAAGARSVMSAAAPAGLSVVLPETPSALKEQGFASCYVAVGTGKLPDFGGTLTAEVPESKVYYFTIKSNMSVLEKALTALDGAGYSAVQRDDVQSITIDAKAENALLVIVQQ